MKGKFLLIIQIAYSIERMSVGQWRRICFPFKQFMKGLRMLEPELIGYFRDGQMIGAQVFLSLVNKFLMNMLLGIQSCKVA